MYSFLLSENSVYSELLENLHVDHKRLTQSKNGVVTFDFKMKLGSTFVKRSILREILLYLTAVVCTDREYSIAEEVLYRLFQQNNIFCPFESILIYLTCSVKCGSITEYLRKKVFLLRFLQWVSQPIWFFSFNISTFATYPQNQYSDSLIRPFLFQQLDQLTT